MSITANIAPRAPFFRKLNQPCLLKTGDGNNSNLLTFAYPQSTVFLLPPPPHHYHHRTRSSPSVTTIVQSKIAAVGIDKVAPISSRAAAT
jgi:hypothetical protein